MKFFLQLTFITCFVFISACSTNKQKPEDGNITKLNDSNTNASVVEKQNTVSSEKPSKTDSKKSISFDYLFPRIIAGYRLSHVEHRLVSIHKKWYAKNIEYLQRVLTRSEPFLFFIVEELEKRQLPMELALLPVIESAYRTEAVSKSKASGLWQFIPSTGRYFGLKQNWWSDQRRDVVLSTQSALDYLKELNEEFDGDWYLAIAAYNGGRGTIRSAIKRNKRKNLPTDFFSLKLNHETTNYVPKLIALSHVIKNSNQYGIKIPLIRNNPYFTAVAIKGQIDMPKLVSETDINDKLFYQLNAGFRRWASSPEGPFRVIVPNQSADKVRNYIASQPTKSRIQWRNHKLKNGDTLYGLSRKYKVSINAIKTINRMKSSRLRAGKTILIPLRARSA